MLRVRLVHVDTWVHHVRHSRTKLYGGDAVDIFLRKRFLRELEVLNLLDRLADAIGLTRTLPSIASVSDSR